MSPENKFRGIRKDNGKWAKGSVRECFTESSGYKEKGPYISWFVADELHEAEVITETVGQTTGLKGTDEQYAFAGDLYEINISPERTEIYCVIWLEDHACFALEQQGERHYLPNIYGSEFADLIQNNVSVGNIHQSPESFSS